MKAHRLRYVRLIYLLGVFMWKIDRGRESERRMLGVYRQVKNAEKNILRKALLKSSKVVGKGKIKGDL